MNIIIMKILKPEVFSNKFRDVWEKAVACKCIILHYKSYFYLVYWRDHFLLAFHNATAPPEYLGPVSTTYNVIKNGMCHFKVPTLMRS